MEAPALQGDIPLTKVAQIKIFLHMLPHWLIGSVIYGLLNAITANNFLPDYSRRQEETVFERLQFLVLPAMAGREIASERSENEREDGLLLS